MKYIFLLLCAFSWQLPAEKVFAQRDSFAYNFINLPIIHQWWEHQGGVSTNGIDTFWNHPIQRLQIFDLVYRHHDTLFFSGTGSGIPQSALEILFDNTTMNFKHIKYYTVDSPPWDTLLLIAHDINAVEQGNNIIGCIEGASMKDFYYYWLYTGTLGGKDGGYEDIDQSFSVMTDSTRMCFSITKQELLDVENISSRKDFKIFPNPAAKNVSFQFASGQKKEVTIFDILGRNILNYKFETTETATLDISPLPIGIYYLRAGNQMQKFVIQR